MRKHKLILFLVFSGKISICESKILVIAMDGSGSVALHSTEGERAFVFGDSNNR